LQIEDVRLQISGKDKLHFNLQSDISNLQSKEIGQKLTLLAESLNRVVSDHEMIRRGTSRGGC
jgi:hypothetical protein